MLATGDAREDRRTENAVARKARTLAQADDEEMFGDLFEEEGQD